MDKLYKQHTGLQVCNMFKLQCYASYVHWAFILAVDMFNMWYIYMA
jgi:hypothetical protein